jgi:hypothetical protein
MTHERSLDEGKIKKQKPAEDTQDKHRPLAGERDKTGLTNLQHTIGNQAVGRLLAQRRSEEPVELDDELAGRITQARGGGQDLDSNVQEQMGASTGHDFSDVRVHTSPEADELSQKLNAKAFTTGRDIFFREGAYDPHSSAGQELIAHELTHVVQQGTGRATNPGGRLSVNAPGDRFEQEADSLAKSITAPGAAAQAQRQEVPEEEELAQAQEMDEEEELAQTQADVPEEEEEEPVQAQVEEPEEEILQTQEEIPEEEI